MDVEILSRVQFAVTIAFHYIFPPMSIGLGLLLVIMEGMYLKTGKELYHQMTRFWVKIFGLIFALGVASGIVMEFQFGTNWAEYSRYVGDIFGAALAAEGIFAFFLESGFLAILLFGWDKVKPRTHFISTVAVAAGAHFSAIWIVVANSWQQTPAGYHIVEKAGGGVRAELTSFWEAVLNPSFLDRISHVYMGAWQAGAFLVLSVSAFYLLRRKHQEFARASIKIALVLAVAASLLQLVTGHSSGVGVAANQPAKLAAYEGHFESGPAPLYIAGWVDEDAGRTNGIGMPGLLSWLVYGDADAPVTGLDAFAEADRPPVNLVFQAFHIMVGVGVLLIVIALLGAVYAWRGKLFETRWLLWIFVFAVLGPQIANQLGWLSAEVGRQPWIVYDLLRTSDALSNVVSASQVLTSLVLFGLIYLLLFTLFVYLLNEKIQAGPGEIPVEEGRRA
ncbi:MAG: cytochrome ubiquinol oxidase subunit I [Gemmatimonadales bacterium]|jgi:cytochrome d ubiquinol oxidase subunit I